MDIGHRLKLFRVAAGLKQGVLAEKLDVSNNHVYMVESGRREPSLDYVTRFSKTVNIPLSVIFMEQANPKDAKARKLTENIMALMAEFAESVGVKKRRA